MYFFTLNKLKVQKKKNAATTWRNESAPEAVPRSVASLAVNSQVTSSSGAFSLSCQWD